MVNKKIIKVLKNTKKLLKKVCFIIIEPNKGVIKKQQMKLEEYLKLGFNILWRGLDELEDKSLNELFNLI